ncbi:MAG: type II toxin-antitoxin system RelE/ParE family toxin [Neorhizobium sp.]|nr:type II toxin-antitoxin system RelE/ParE family toxin [Neorhizobium sp.]
MIPVRLSRNAANYLRRETDYLRRRNPAAAGRFVDTIRQARRLLQAFPDAGNQAHALQIAGNRVLVVGDYLIEYAHDVTHIDITSIRHGRAAVKTPPVETAHPSGDANFGRSSVGNPSVDNPGIDNPGIDNQSHVMPGPDD